VTYHRKIRYSDTDAQGIVFNGNYFTYFDDALTDLLEVAGLTAETRHEAGYDIVTAHVEIDFKSAATLGDTVVTEARVDRVGTASVTFTLQSRVEADGRLAASGEVVFVTVDADTMRPVRVPDPVVAAFRAVQDDPIATG
jgi:YbgC/YbaW family acyl-CoA thioester hydrolase